jgi:hypothetical protein
MAIDLVSKNTKMHSNLINQKGRRVQCYVLLPCCFDAISNNDYIKKRDMEYKL